jgi:protein-arginine kinase activator protein McsA
VKDLDNEQIIKQFDEIEQKVERVIDVYKSCETKNLELTNKIVSLEEELQNKVETEKRYQEERTLIRSKIDNLLARLGDLAER